MFLRSQTWLLRTQIKTLHPYEWGILGIKALDFYPIFDCADCSHCSCCCGGFCGGDRRRKSHNSRCCGSCRRGRTCPVQAECRSLPRFLISSCWHGMNQAIGLMWKLDRPPADLSVRDSHRRSKPPPKKLANFWVP